MIFNLFKKKEKISIEFISNLSKEENDELDKRMEETKKLRQINDKYFRIVEKHYNINEKLRFNLYSKAINEPNIKNKYTNECLKLCYEDMQLLPELVKYWEEENEIRKFEMKYPCYGSHIIYIKLLDKLEKYDDAIEICDYYINNGFNFDGTKGGLIARKERILKKMNKDE